MNKYKLRTSLGKINKMCVKMNKTKKVREMKVAQVTFLVHLFLQYWQTWLLAQVLGKVHHWHWTKEILWKVSFLEHCLNKFLVCRRLHFYWTSALARKIRVDYKMTKNWKFLERTSENRWKKSVSLKLCQKNLKN